MEDFFERVTFAFGPLIWSGLKICFGGLVGMPLYFTGEMWLVSIETCFWVLVELWRLLGILLFPWGRDILFGFEVFTLDTIVLASFPVSLVVM